MLKILAKENSILNHFVAEMRDENIQKDMMRFRRNMERMGEIMAYEISRTLDYTVRNVVTPLGEAPTPMFDDRIVLAPILRAGVPMMNGFLNYFDSAEVAFVSAHRHYRKNGQMEIVMQHITTPSIEDKILIIIDPMLATGASIEIAYEALIEKGGVPRHTHICAAICSTDGVEYVQSRLPKEKITLWAAAIDNEMTVKSYIVPGIGDTGDLAYGEKL